MTFHVTLFTGNKFNKNILVKNFLHTFMSLWYKENIYVRGGGFFWMLRYGKRGVLEIITKYNKGEGGSQKWWKKP